MVTALVLSGGTGTRVGGEIPKQYIEVKGRPIIAYCLRTLLFHEGIDAVQIVAEEAWRETILKCVNALCEGGAEGKPGQEEEEAPEPGGRGNSKFRGFSAPGKTRQLSILNGLEDIRRYAGDSDYVLVHDAARPLVSAGQIAVCIEAVRAGHDGALPVLPMKDTVYLSEDGKAVTSLLDRKRVFAGQAPEIFVLGKYLEANRALLLDRIREINGSTEPAILAGMDVAMIPGDEGNYKITTKQDLKRFQERYFEH